MKVESQMAAVNGRMPVCESLRRPGDVVLRDGSTVHLRSMRLSDEQDVLKLLQSLSEDARYQRFFCPIKDSALVAEAHREVTLEGTVSLVALHGEEERVVGHAFFAALNQTRAEVAFTIVDEFRPRFGHYPTGTTRRYCCG